MRRLVLLLVLVLAAAGGSYAYRRLGAAPLVLTGIVTTNDVIVSAQIGGRIADLRAGEGDTVRKDQLIAVIAPEELKADTAYFAQNVEGLSSQVRESEAALRYQQRLTADQIRQAESTLASTEAQVEAAAADVESARLTHTRTQNLAQQGVVSPQEMDQARTGLAAAQAKLDALKKQVEAQRAAVALARSNAEQVLVRQSQVKTQEHLQAAASAQRAKADVRLRYTEIHAPIDGIVDVRAARVGEVVNPGQPIITLVNPDDLWVRADIEESYIDRVRIGDTLTVRLPSGAEMEGTVFYRGIDAAFATQRDVSRTKRDIKTFEVRLRVDNKDRRLAVGMTAYVVLPMR
jgi:multidrug resistance efflux pump